MKSISWQAFVMVGLSATLWAAEVTQSNYVAPSTQPPGRASVVRITAQATVEKIDYKKRMVRLKSETGETQEMQVGPEVQRFNEIKKGDIVQVDYEESNALYVKKKGETGEPAHDSGMMAGRMNTESPAAGAVGTERISAEVVKVDMDKRELTLKGPDGTISTMAVPAEVRRLSEIKKGDHVVAERSMAVVLSVQKKP